MKIWQKTEFEFLNARQGQQSRALHIEEYLWHWIEYLTFFSSPNYFISRISMKIPKTKSIPEVDSNNIFAKYMQKKTKLCSIVFVICSCSFISSLNLICFFSYWKTNPILWELRYKKKYSITYLVHWTVPSWFMTLQGKMRESSRFTNCNKMECFLVKFWWNSAIVNNHL